MKKHLKKYFQAAALGAGITFIAMNPVFVLALTPAGMTAFIHQAALRYNTLAPETSPIPVPRPKEQLP